MAATAGSRLPARYSPWSAAAATSPMHDLYCVGHDDLLALRAFVRALVETPRRRQDGAYHPRQPARLPVERRGAPTGGRRTFESCLTDLAEAVEDWFDSGAQMAPVFGERIQLFLQRSGRQAWERAFLSVYLYHFAACHVGPHAGLLHRARELRAYPSHRRTDRPALPPATRQAAARQAAPPRRPSFG